MYLPAYLWWFGSNTISLEIGNTFSVKSDHTKFPLFRISYTSLLCYVNVAAFNWCFSCCSVLLINHYGKSSVAAWSTTLSIDVPAHRTCIGEEIRTLNIPPLYHYFALNYILNSIFWMKVKPSDSSVLTSSIFSNSTWLSNSIFYRLPFWEKYSSLTRRKWHSTSLVRSNGKVWKLSHFERWPVYSGYVFVLTPSDSTCHYLWPAPSCNGGCSILSFCIDEHFDSFLILFCLLNVVLSSYIHI